VVFPTLSPGAKGNGFPHLITHFPQSFCGFAALPIKLTFQVMSETI
jgi:hypothetical protein